MKEQIENKNVYKCLYCDRELLRFLDDDTVHILGSCGRYTINFNSIDAICSFCNKRNNKIISSAAREVKSFFEQRVKKDDKEAIDYIKKKSSLLIPYRNLTAREEFRVLKILTEKRKKIFNYLMSEKNASIDKIMKEFRLNEKTVRDDVEIIAREVLKVKPSFKGYYKTPCYLPEIRKRTVIKPLDT